MTLSDLSALFLFTVHPMEIVLRGTLVYWFLFLLFRFVLRRDVGSIGIADVLLLVLIADASQNAMAGGYESVAEGFLLVATIAGWNYALDWAGYHFTFIRRFIEPAPLLLIRDGRMLRRNMRQELVSPEELLAKLREQGLEDVSQVRSAFMESSGEISVLKRRSASG